MVEFKADRPSRTIRVFSSPTEQELETIRYWNAQSIDEKLRQTFEATAMGYAMKGIDVHTQGSNRSVVRFQREGR